MHDHHHNGSAHHAHHHSLLSGTSGYALAPSAGHNARPPAQWQAPHPGHDGAGEPEADFDLVENAFVESFPKAADPTSFLRLAGVPFAASGADGAPLHLLRVEFEEITDVAAVTPQLGGGSVRVDPLPAQMVSRRRRLRFAYQSQSEVLHLSLAEARCLKV